VPLQSSSPAPSRIPVTEVTGNGRAPSGRHWYTGPAFTLVEVVLVLVIMSLVIAVAQPRIAGYVINDRVRRSADRLAMDLRLAQSEAIKQQQTVTVTFDTVKDLYTLSGLSPDSQGATTRTVTLGSESSYQTELDVVEFAATGLSAVTFDSFGTPDSGGTIALLSGSILCTVSVDSVTGQPTVSALSSQQEDTTVVEED